MSTRTGTAFAAACLVVAGTAGADWTPGDSHKMHYPQIPDLNGLDVDFTTPRVLADDWRCSQSGYVSDVHVWFSSIGDWYDPDAPVAGQIGNVHLSIHENIPAGVGGIPFARPGALLWQADFGPDQVIVRFYAQGEQGWFDPVTGECIPNDHQNIFQLNVENIQDAFYQQQGTIYWLDVSIEADQPIGWKSSACDQFGDDGVYDVPGVDPPWRPLVYPDCHPLGGQSMDLAFVIGGKPVDTKWRQRPHGDKEGFNVPSNIDWQAMGGMPCPTCTCDLNGDGTCDGADLQQLLGCFGSPPGPTCPDLNCDGVIDGADLNVWQCLAMGGANCCPVVGGVGPNVVVADDFQSDGRPITCVRWWGSYVDPAYEPDPAGGGGGLPIDGWFLSFHGDTGNPGPVVPSLPLELLGLYFCPEASITIVPTPVIGWDQHRVWEYFVELGDCCLVHARLDSRDNTFPARPGRFLEVAQSVYWLDVQATVGHIYEEVQLPNCPCDCDLNNDGACDVNDLIFLLACFGGPGCPDVNCDGVNDSADIDALVCRIAGFPADVCCPGVACVELPTNNAADTDFWGWHTSPDNWNNNSQTGNVAMGAGNEWLYENWVPVDGEPHGLPIVDQAFELLTPVECPWDCANDDGVVNIRDLLALLAQWGGSGNCDFDHDCIVDITDLLALLAAWGSCGP